MAKNELTAIIKKTLGTEGLSVIGGGSGCISSGTAYRTSDGRQVFVKVNSKPDALRMFVGEEASLNAIHQTQTILCPRPIKVLENIPGGGSAIIMDYMDLQSRENATTLGEDLARLHLHNLTLLDSNSESAVRQFGFAVPTCCGYLPQQNEWRDDWVDFYCEKIDHQLSLQKPRDTKADELWSRLRPKVRSMFDGVKVMPSLLHGDLWSGNSGQTSAGPVVYDPASFYGHHEYDLAIASMFGAYSLGSAFAKAYHKLIPKQPGFDRRLTLYTLFHYVNHWNHFGGGYRSSSISIMEQLLKE